MKRIAFILSLTLLCHSVAAAPLSVAVVDASGKPVKDAVVTFTPSGGADMSLANRNGPFVMAQHNIMFNPFVLAVPVGSTVAFPNQDKVNHHVYSFSPAQPFQLPLYGHGQTRSVKFDHEGTIALGCNIHDSMKAYIRVVATPYFALTDDTGKVTINLPEGAGVLAVWQPNMDGSPDHQMARSFTATHINAPQSFSIKVHQMMPMGGAY